MQTKLPEFVKKEILVTAKFLRFLYLIDGNYPTLSEPKGESFIDLTTVSLNYYGSITEWIVFAITVTII